MLFLLLLFFSNHQYSIPEGKMLKTKQTDHSGVLTVALMVRCYLSSSSICNVCLILWLNGTSTKNCLKKQIGLPDRAIKSDPLRPPIPQNEVTDCTPNTVIANCGQTASVI